MACLIFMAVLTPANANPKYASIVMDADTGMILSQRYSNKVLHPASLTKMMTLLMAFEALDRGTIRKTDRVRISRRAASMVPSKLGLPAGSSIKVEDAIYALVTKSANDIAVALAEHIGGSESKFAAMMTNRARTIGMSKTRFKNASGLHNRYQVSTARDMAKLGRYILQRHPHYYGYFSTKSFTYRGKTYRSHNRLMSSYKGMDGFKTGYINASGFNLVASANRNGRRLIGVVFGGRTSKSRNSHMASLLDKGFSKVKNIRMARVKTPPRPTQKPFYGVADAQTPNNQPQFASLSALELKNKRNNEVKPNYTALTKALQEGQFGEMIGEGDFDDSASKRIETGLLAIAVHKGEGSYQLGDLYANETEQVIPPMTHPKDIVGKWAIQIGAFTDQASTEKALKKAKAKLPKAFANVSSFNAPLRTADGIIYRARLGGLTEKKAAQACKYFKDCLAIAPISTQISAN